MPDEYVAPVMVNINGIRHRASVLTWFPMTDCADAIDLRGYMTGKQTTYPVYIEKGKCPIMTITNAVGVKFNNMIPQIAKT